MLSHTPVSGTIQNATVQAMKMGGMDLTDTLISGTIPQSFALSGTKLKDVTRHLPFSRFWFSSTRLSGTFPSIFGSLHCQLNSLRGWRTALSGTLPSLEAAPVNDIYFTDTRLSGTLPDLPRH